MKHFLALLALLPAACTHPTPAAKGRAEGPAPEIGCELLGIEFDEGTALASFRATNTTLGAVSYHGYSDAGPIYQCEVQEDGDWQGSPLGWCGTGVSQYELEPGASLAFEVVLPMDGRSYRFTFGEPPVRTPPVSATPK